MEKNLLDALESLLDKKIENIVLINKRTFMFLFNEAKTRLIISLNHHEPNIYLINKDDFYASFESPFLDSLKRDIKELSIEKITNKENSSFIQIDFKESSLNLLAKLISFKPNLYLKNKEEIIDCFYKENNAVSVEKNEKSIKKLNEEEIKKHFENEIKIREKEKYEYFTTFLKGKIKRVKNKIENINRDKIKALDNLKYVSYADAIYCLNPNLKAHLKEIKIKDEIVKLDESKRLIDNLNDFYKIAKKAKETIRLSETNILRGEEELKIYQTLLERFNSSASEKEKENIILESNFFKKKCEIKKTSFNKPYKINYNGTIIYFGKNASQNDYLSFVKKLDREFAWLHIKNLSGSHIIIASKKPTEKELLLASQLACLLSKVGDGIVSYTKKKNVRRGKVLGEAILKNYSSLKINRVSEEVKEIYQTAVRDN